MNRKQIDDYHLAMLRLILMDERVLSAMNVDGQNAQKIVVRADGSIDIGKYKYGWVNKLFNSYYTISFFEVAQRIAMVITGGKSNNCDKDGLVGFIFESVDKILKKDEKEKVIELLLHYCTLISETSPLRLTYQSKDNALPDGNRNSHKRYMRMAGKADAVIDFGKERIPVNLIVNMDLPSDLNGWDELESKNIIIISSSRVLVGYSATITILIML